MPTDTNPNGDMFGGWMMSMMDLAGASHAIRIANGPVVTVAVDAMTFHAPAYVGDEVSCYTSLEEIGNTSVRIKIDSFARRNRMRGQTVKITTGSYTYVAIDSERKPRPIKR
jgi:acyl-CoA thioesterase YciA